MPTTQQAKYQQFKILHERPGAFVIPNPWNAGTARFLTALGFEALATTSAGLGLAIGRRDSAGGLSREVVLENAKEILEATPLPVSADLEEGFGPDPASCADTIEQAAGIGLVGGSIEDATGDPDDPIFDFERSVDRVRAAAEASRDLPFILTARAENFLYGRADLEDTIKRLQAFEEAGAEVLYAPGLPSLEAISAVCAAVDKPVNVVMGLSGTTYSLEELQAVGVKRISVGGAFARAALGAFLRAAKEVKEQGTFTFAAEALPDVEVRGLMMPTKRS